MKNLNKQISFLRGALPFIAVTYMIVSLVVLFSDDPDFSALATLIVGFPLGLALPIVMISILFSMGFPSKKEIYISTATLLVFMCSFITLTFAGNYLHTEGFKYAGILAIVFFIISGYFASLAHKKITTRTISE